MTVSTRLGLALLPAALALGILGDWLLRCTPWGVSVLLWVLAGLVGLFVLARRLGIAALGEGMWLAAPALVLAAGLAWRDSATPAPSACSPGRPASRSPCYPSSWPRPWPGCGCTRANTA